jgi:hypothetical protein
MHCDNLEDSLVLAILRALKLANETMRESTLITRVSVRSYICTIARGATTTC